MCVIFRASDGGAPGDSFRAWQELPGTRMAGADQDALGAERAAGHSQEMDRTIVGSRLAEVSTPMSGLPAPLGRARQLHRASRLVQPPLLLRDGIRRHFGSLPQAGYDVGPAAHSTLRRGRPRSTYWH